MNFLLRRTADTDLSTAGLILDAAGAELCKTLERGPRNPDHIRIPAGSYQIARKPIGQSEFDKSFKVLLGDAYKGILWLPAVPGRTNIEIHTANFFEQLLGCIATGTALGRDPHGHFSIPGGLSSPAYRRLYLAISPQIDAGGADLDIRDIATDVPMV